MRFEVNKGALVFLQRRAASAVLFLKAGIRPPLRRSAAAVRVRHRMRCASPYLVSTVARTRPHHRINDAIDGIGARPVDDGVAAVARAVHDDDTRLARRFAQIYHSIAVIDRGPATVAVDELASARRIARGSVCGDG